MGHETCIFELRTSYLSGVSASHLHLRHGPDILILTPAKKNIEPARAQEHTSGDEHTCHKSLNLSAAEAVSKLENY